MRSVNDCWYFSNNLELTYASIFNLFSRIMNLVESRASEMILKKPDQIRFLML